MITTPVDQALSALRVAPIETVGVCISSVTAFVSFALGFDWFETATVIALIFGALLYRSSSIIIEDAQKRAKARMRKLYPY
jgi:hypothetical protein